MSLVKTQLVEVDERLRQTIQSYYDSAESWFCYEFMLGGAEHYGYYQKGTHWPFDVEKSLERFVRCHYHSLIW